MGTLIIIMPSSMSRSLTTYHTIDNLQVRFSKINLGLFGTLLVSLKLKLGVPDVFISASLEANWGADSDATGKLRQLLVLSPTLSSSDAIHGTLRRYVPSFPHRKEIE